MRFLPGLWKAHAAILLGLWPVWAQASAKEPAYRSPIYLCLSADGRYAYAVNHTADSVSVVDLQARRVVGEIPVGPRPVHAAVSPDGRRLYVTSLYGGRVEVVDLPRRRVVRAFRTGHEPYGVAVSSDGARLYVVNSLSDTVSVIDSGAGRTLSDISVGRSPRFLARTPEGSRLVVANGLSRDISVVDIAAGRVAQTRGLSPAAILRQVLITPDGKWAIVAHEISRDTQVPTQVERGWIHSNGFSLLDLNRPDRRATLLLDRLLDGAANPWGLALSSDGRRLYVSLAGVHEVALVDLEKALRLVAETPPEGMERLAQDVEVLEKRKIARRVGSGGLGPRGMALDEARGELLVANYFSDSVAVLDADSGALKAVIRLNPPAAMTLRRKGEFLFNDASITFQRWFSCASCHQEDATMDGLNWDLTNDGVGNPKNVKSMHDIHDTPPAMWTAVREDMNAAVAAGQRFAGFLPDPENHRALLEYIGHPRPAPNPYRGAAFREAVKRGWKVFVRARCDACHPPPLFTDKTLHDLSLAKPSDPSSRFDTPSLRECYRTAPYLHDGRAKTLEEVFTRHDPEDLHGRTKGLSKREMEDLVAYLRSL